MKCQGVYANKEEVKSRKKVPEVTSYLVLQYNKVDITATKTTKIKQQL